MMKKVKQNSKHSDLKIHFQNNDKCIHMMKMKKITQNTKHCDSKIHLNNSRKAAKDPLSDDADFYDDAMHCVQCLDLYVQLESFVKIKMVKGDCILCGQNRESFIFSF